MKINGRDCFDSQNIPVEGALFEREAQILTARQGIAGTTGFVGTRKTATPSSHPKNHHWPTASSDRLVHNPHPIEMRGDSMRKNRGKAGG
jgi:hypothetical protein